MGGLQLYVVCDLWKIHNPNQLKRTHLALMHPSLFQGLILLDPVIQRENPSRKYALPSTYRRDLWSSRADAAEKFRSSRFYQTWDPRVLQKWIEYGLRDLPTKLYPNTSETGSPQPAVTLTTPKSQELFTFLRSSYVDDRSGLSRGLPKEEMHPDDIDSFPFYRPEPPQIFRRLPELKPAVLYLFGNKSDLSSPSARQEKLRVTGTGVGGSGGVSRGRVQEVVLPCGHLVPIELVRESAQASADFMNTEFSHWESQALALRKAWEGISHEQRTSIDGQWKTHMGVLPKRPKL